MGFATIGEIRGTFPAVALPLNLTLLIGPGMGLLAGAGELAGLPLLAILPFIFIILIENLRKTLGTALIASKAESKVHASVMSAQSQFKSLPAALVSVLLGYFSDLLSVGWAYIIVSALFLVLLPFYSAART